MDSSSLGVVLAFPKRTRAGSAQPRSSPLGRDWRQRLVEVLMKLGGRKSTTALPGRHIYEASSHGRSAPDRQRKWTKRSRKVDACFETISRAMVTPPPLPTALRWQNAMRRPGGRTWCALIALALASSDARSRQAHARPFHRRGRNHRQAGRALQFPASGGRGRKSQVKNPSNVSSSWLAPQTSTAR